MITIPVSFGELVDKLTILELKKRYIKNENQLKNINYSYKNHFYSSSHFIIRGN